MTTKIDTNIFIHLEIDTTEVDINLNVVDFLETTSQIDQNKLETVTVDITTPSVLEAQLNEKQAKQFISNYKELIIAIPVATVAVSAVIVAMLVTYLLVTRHSREVKSMGVVTSIEADTTTDHTKERCALEDSATSV